MNSDKDEEHKNLYESDDRLQRDVQVIRKNWDVSKNCRFTKDGSRLECSQYKYRFMIEFLETNANERSDGVIQLWENKTGLHSEMDIGVGDGFHNVGPNTSIGSEGTKKFVDTRFERNISEALSSSTFKSSTPGSMGKHGKKREHDVLKYSTPNSKALGQAYSGVKTLLSSVRKRSYGRFSSETSFSGNGGEQAYQTYSGSKIYKYEPVDDASNDVYVGTAHGYRNIMPIESKDLSCGEISSSRTPTKVKTPITKTLQVSTADKSEKYMKKYGLSSISPIQKRKEASESVLHHSRRITTGSLIPLKSELESNIFDRKNDEGIFEIQTSIRPTRAKDALVSMNKASSIRRDHTPKRPAKLSALYDELTESRKAKKRIINEEILRVTKATGANKDLSKHRENTNATEPFILEGKNSDVISELKYKSNIYDLRPSVGKSTLDRVQQSQEGVFGHVDRNPTLTAESLNGIYLSPNNHGLNIRPGISSAWTKKHRRDFISEDPTPTHQTNFISLNNKSMSKSAQKEVISVRDTTKEANFTKGRGVWNTIRFFESIAKCNASNNTPSKRL
ncbi:hypothetical protein AX774_g4865 [Zancudomyces culisetae]|uniref:Uncharacterized protein n=1 Tax=Zancudomyces culisetae TaxID=1213189 RepID=A0A1R1PL31_ZANCU|nr:hypothetical protein AX774_g4865 [Zancudomyces culisetae]|eukprot:OMH81666.1 hypothetical protein AX774_g4865 [Zancudomyces culisetae]